MNSKSLSVYQHWDPLQTCLVGRSYPPEFYSFITNTRARDVMARIAQETEEDYQKLISLLQRFGVHVLRPDVPTDWRTCYSKVHQRIMPPPMTPRDFSIMLGENFYLADLGRHFDTKWHSKDKPCSPEPLWCFWDSVIQEIAKTNPVNDAYHANFDYSTAVFCGAMTTRCGRDIYVGTQQADQDRSADLALLRHRMPQYRWHIVDTGGTTTGILSGDTWIDYQSMRCGHVRNNISRLGSIIPAQSELGPGAAISRTQTAKPRQMVGARRRAQRRLH